MAKGGVRLATGLLNDFNDNKVKELFEKKPWMNDVKFNLITTRKGVEELIDLLIEKGLCALDTETTSLNTRKDPEGKSVARLVGICLAWNMDEGFYIPVGHQDKEFNVPEDFVVRELKRLVKNCRCIYHNFKYDGQILKNYGITINDPDMFEDTFLMAGVVDASSRGRGLKGLSEKILERPMVEIDQLGIETNKKGIVSFDLVPPEIALYYGAPDAMNTFGLYLYFKRKLDEQDPNGTKGPWSVYNKIEKRCILVTMDMESNYVRIDKDYLVGCRNDVVIRMEKTKAGIYEVSGRKFDIASPKQLGEVLFDEMKVKYPEKERTASGQYMTSEKTLSKIKGAPIVDLVLDYRGYQKVLGTYIENFVENLDENNEAKFQMNQLRADTGRYSASGGKGINIDGYCGINCQNIPVYDPKDHTSIDIRKSLIGRPGTKIVTIDYSGEELRIAANFSQEPKWVDEFLHGEGDLHSITARIIYNKRQVDKQERGVGKCVAKGTLIASSKGWVPIETLKVGDKVVTHTGMLKKVESVHDMGIKKGRYLETNSGHKITCGVNHRFLTIKDKWVRAEDLIVDQKIKSFFCEDLLSDNLSVVFDSCEISLLEDVKKVELWDLTVGEDHTYIAEGLVTHNTLNFLTMYGGGAGGFAQLAKIPYETAKKMIMNFFREYKGLKRWISSEAARSRKRGYSLTFLGRRRPLHEFYNTTDKTIQAKGDRCAVNAAIQGCLQPHERCLTNKGYIAIKEIEERKLKGEDFLVWTGTSWEDFDVINRGKCQFAKLTLQNGLKIDCDTRHEVLTVGDKGYEFKKYKDLNEQDEVCVSIPNEIEFGNYPKKRFFSGGVANNSKDIYLKDASDYEFVVYLMGVIIGDGNVRFGHRKSKYSVTISFGKNDLENNYVKILKGVKKLGLNVGKLRRTKGSIGESYQASINSKALVSLFTYYGYEEGKTSKTKRIPKLIFESPISLRKSFLKGYFSADGCKKFANKYSFHTANYELLEDTQILGWTLGIASYVKTQSDGTHILCWSDVRRAEVVLGLKKNQVKRRSGGTMALPLFMYEEVYNLLKDKRMALGKDRALLCNLNKKRPITVTTVIKLLNRFDCRIPEMYYHYKIRSKKSLDKVNNTYTLSVHSPLHRFDSSCIISKNTGADILKIALYRCWKWIQDNGFQDDVRILLPIHDEIVFEIKEDKLDFYIPELCEIMKIRDLTDKLGWKIPLEVDAEYGDSFHVTNDYWEEYEALKKEGKAPEILNHTAETKEKEQQNTEVSTNEESKEAKPEEKIESQEKPTNVVTKSADKSSGSTEASITDEAVPGATNLGHFYQFNLTVRDDVIGKVEKKEKVKEILDDVDDSHDPALQDNRIRDRIDKRGYLIYTIDRMDYVTLQQFKTALEILVQYGDKLFIGPSCKICLVKINGEVLYEFPKKVSVDGFLALCTWLKI